MGRGARTAGLCALPALMLLLAGCAVPLAPPPVAPAPAPAPPAAAQPAGSWSGKVVGVSDGDTLSVMHEGHAEKIRLFGVDCPEKGQDYGERAKQFTSAAAFKKTVVVRPVDTDRYGRTVAWVGLPDGRSLNEALVEAGLAWWYREYARKDTRLEALEDAARRARRGLWAQVTPVAPWEYRRAQRGG